LDNIPFDIAVLIGNGILKKMFNSKLINEEEYEDVCYSIGRPLLKQQWWDDVEVDVYYLIC
jgi:hypothetical protein